MPSLRQSTIADPPPVKIWVAARLMAWVMMSFCAWVQKPVPKNTLPLRGRATASKGGGPSSAGGSQASTEHADARTRADSFERRRRLSMGGSSTTQDRAFRCLSHGRPKKSATLQGPGAHRREQLLGVSSGDDGGGAPIQLLQGTKPA